MMARPQWILSQEQFRLQAGNSLLVRTSAMIHTTPPSQGGGTGSNPVGAANEKTSRNFFAICRRLMW